MSEELPDDTDAIQTLTVEQAQHLASQDGDLSLNGLTAISDEVAEALSQHAGGWLRLDGLSSVSARTAAALIRHEDAVTLESLFELTSYELAAKLAPYTSFENLAEISADAARALVEAEDTYFEFGGLRNLEADTARVLARLQASLSFEGLRDLPEEVAASLAMHEERLSFPGLSTISAGAASALALHKGPLHLDGITSLSSEAAQALAKLQSELSLDGLTDLPAEVAKELGSHAGALYLNAITSLSSEAAHSLATHAGSLDLNGLKTLSTAAAKGLAPHEELLSLSGLEMVADDTARALSKHKGGLRLNGLTKLSDTALQSFSTFTGWILCLDGLPTISAKAAAMLSRQQADLNYNGGLSLHGLKDISTDVAESLARYRGRLFLRGVEEISDRAAKALAAHKGHLSLESLKSLSDRAAEWLATGADVDVDLEMWPESAAARYRDIRDSIAAQDEQSMQAHADVRPVDGRDLSTDEGGVRSTLELRDVIAAAPDVLSPTGHYGVLLERGTPLAREHLLRYSDAPHRLRSDVQFAIGDYLGSLPVPEAPAFASHRNAPDGKDGNRIRLALSGVPAAVTLDAISADTLRRLYDAATPARFGDMKTMETRVDPLVRSGREIGPEGFKVDPALCDWVRRTWAEHMQPEAVRVEPYKINLYAPGDRFTLHRDTPEKNLVGTFLLALSGWGEACSGGGLVVHDKGGSFHWDGVRGWAAFVPYLPHEVEPISSGARVALAFKVFATNPTTAAERPQFDEALLEEAADRIALCRNERGEVGVLLQYSYSLNGTALCGADRFIYHALERLGTVQSVPVAVRLKAAANDSETSHWTATANVYTLSKINLATVAKHMNGKPSNNSADSVGSIPFIAVSDGHMIYSDGHGPIERVGNWAEPANIDTLYVHRALIVTAPADSVSTAVRCASADLARTNLSGRDLRMADFQGASLMRASLARANLQGAFLANTDLSNANLRRANLIGADLACADLTRAQLAGACLRDASLKDACFEGVKWDADTVWPEGFDPCQHGAAPMHSEPPEGPDPEDLRRQFFG